MLAQNVVQIQDPRPAGSIASYRTHSSANQPTFFDRGIPDTLCYARIINLAKTDEIEVASKTYRYYPRVFLAPPWKEIYSTDEERKQTFEDAVHVYEAMLQVYQECGYEIVELARVRVAARADFVVSQLSFTF
ncbi:MAG: AAA family ATPase [Candidatus Korobacteraceae bacterium]